MYLIHILPKTGMTQWYNGVHSTDAKNMYKICWFLPSIQFPQKYFLRQDHSIKNAFAVSYLAQFLGPIALKIFLPYGYAIKKVHNILLYEAGQFYVKNKMAAE